MTIKMILATDQCFGIGKDNKIPWDCPEDMQYFKEKTENSVVIMGKGTWQSLPMYPSGLPNRENYVLSSKIKEQTLYSYDYPTTEKLAFCSSVESILTELQVCEYEDTWIIGGASLYNELHPYVEEVHHTIIDGDYNCDTKVNLSFLEDWELTNREDLSDKTVVNVWRRVDL